MSQPLPDPIEPLGPRPSLVETPSSERLSVRATPCSKRKRRRRPRPLVVWTQMFLFTAAYAAFVASILIAALR